MTSFDVDHITRWKLSNEWSDAKVEATLTDGSCGVDCDAAVCIQLTLRDGTFYIGDRFVSRHVSEGLDKPQTIFIAARDTPTNANTEILMLAKVLRNIADTLDGGRDALINETKIMTDTRRLNDGKPQTTTITTKTTFS